MASKSQSQYLKYYSVYNSGYQNFNHMNFMKTNSGTTETRG